MRILIVSMLSMSLGGVAFAEEKAIGYEKDIRPLLVKYCTECHGPPKLKDGKLKNPKAGLRLDTPEYIVSGSEDGAVLVPGQPDKSRMYTLTTLAEDDEDVMPTKGDLMKPEEIERLRLWILQGADFGREVKAEPKQGGHEGHDHHDHDGHDHGAHGYLYQKKLETLSAELKSTQRPPEFIAEGRISLRKVRPDLDLLRVEVVSEAESIRTSDLKPLRDVAAQIVELRLAGSGVDAEVLDLVSEFSNLVKLDLSRTKLGDDDLKRLAGLRHLEWLNLYQTGISDRAIPSLESMVGLGKLYVGETLLTATLMGRLKQSRLEIVN